MKISKRPNEIYTDRARLLEAIEEARNRDRRENPDRPEPWGGKNYGFVSIERATGIYHNSLYRALNGNGNLTINTLIRLTNYTGVSIDYLLGLDSRKFLTGREPQC
jgi:hypothetical protein